MAKGMIRAGVMSVGLAGGAAQAQEIGFGGSLEIVSDYIASGETQSSGRPALQFTGYAYVPQGFYVGIFLSNVDFTGPFGPYPDAERVELGLFLGWEYEFENGIALDVGYERYWYDTGECCGNFYLGVSSYLTDQFEIGGRATWDPQSGNTNFRATMAVYPTEQIGLRALVGRNKSGLFDTRVTYANVGIDYYFTDSVTASLDFHNSNSPVKSSNVVLGLSYSF